MRRIRESARFSGPGHRRGRRTVERGERGATMHVTVGPAGTIRIPRERCRIQRRAVRVEMQPDRLPVLDRGSRGDHAGSDSASRPTPGSRSLRHPCHVPPRVAVHVYVMPRPRQAGPEVRGCWESGWRRVVLLLDPARHLIRRTGLVPEGHSKRRQGTARLPSRDA